MALTRTCNFVDADGHMLQPLNLWDDKINPAFRERRPRSVIDGNGKERLTVQGQASGQSAEHWQSRLHRRQAGQGRTRQSEIRGRRTGGFDRRARVVDMESRRFDSGHPMT
jgi:uncharacterized protein